MSRRGGDGAYFWKTADAGNHTECNVADFVRIRHGAEEALESTAIHLACRRLMVTHRLTSRETARTPALLQKKREHARIPVQPVVRDLPVTEETHERNVTQRQADHLQFFGIRTEKARAPSEA
jgi:hypothetical protein